MVQDTRIAPRRDELITSDNRMTQRFAEFLESQTDTVNSLDEKSGVQDSLIALSNRQRGKITVLEQEVEDLKEMIFELSARKKPAIEEDKEGDARFSLNVFNSKFTVLSNRLEDIEAEAGHSPKIPKPNPLTVIGSSSSTDNAIARFDGATGVLLQNSGVIIDNSNNLTGVGGLDMTGTATNKLVVPSSNVSATPTISFGDGDTGFYETNDDDLTVSIEGTPVSIWIGASFSGGTTTGNPSMLSEVSSSTNPVWSFVGDADTGIGRSAPDFLSLIAGGIPGIVLQEADDSVIVINETDNAITASVTQTQGQQPLISTWNTVTTVANTNDTVTLTGAKVGAIQRIFNEGVNTLQIFPAAFDDLGAGTDNPTTLAAGANISFFANNAANWLVMT